MADNVDVTPGSGATIRLDDVGGVLYQVVKLDVGADGASAPVSNSNPVPISDAGSTVSIDDGGGSITVDGSVSVTGNPSVVNAGTFAVQENGAALTALQVMDDWDESDRVKVNPIVGQAGVAAGAGAVGATVQRVTLASDDPLVTQTARGATASLSNVNDTNVSTTLLSANTGRKKCIIYNDSTVALYVKYGTTASATSFTHLLQAGESFSEEHYTGRIDGIWASDASGAARVTEITT